MAHHERQRGEFEITTDQRRLDLGTIHRFLAQESYWAGGVSIASCAAAWAALMYPIERAAIEQPVRRSAPISSVCC
jgi:hypothetical protein